MKPTWSVRRFKPISRAVLTGYTNAGETVWRCGRLFIPRKRVLISSWPRCTIFRTLTVRSKSRHRSDHAPDSVGKLMQGRAGTQHGDELIMTTDCDIILQWG